TATSFLTMTDLPFGAQFDLTTSEHTACLRLTPFNSRSKRPLRAGPRRAGCAHRTRGCYDSAHSDGALPANRPRILARDGRSVCRTSWRSGAWSSESGDFRVREYGIPRPEIDVRRVRHSSCFRGRAAATNDFRSGDEHAVRNDDCPREGTGSIAR